jgi:hypothetical protein
MKSTQAQARSAMLVRLTQEADRLRQTALLSTEQAECSARVSFYIAIFRQMMALSYN